MPKLLQALVQSHLLNKNRARQGFRYTDELIRQFSMLSKDLGGKQCYEFWAKNLPLPSLSTVAAHSHKATRPIVEGEFRFQELRDYLDSKGLGRKVVLEEDGSRIIGRIEYDPKTNQLVGFEPELTDNGLPKVASFEASSSEAIEDAFRTNSSSNYVYAIMAQPLVDVPAFPLCIFGTNNKFSALQVEKRWKWTVKEAAKYGIIVVGFSSDGDPRLLCAMKRWTFGTGPLTVLPEWKSFFFAPMDLKGNANEPINPLCFQDTVHTVAKMKNQLLSPRSDRNFMPMGDYVVSGSFLQILVKNESKLEHGLCMSDLTSSDKMNFRAAQKISHDRVLGALKSVPGSEATRAYLIMLRGVMDSFLEKDLKATERVYLMWKSNIFLRLWRVWLVENNYDVRFHFITANTYQCVEVTAHSLVNMIRLLRIRSEPQFFVTWKMTSQACERHFGDARSCTPTFSTAINMSMLGFLQRTRKIERITDIRHQLNEKEGIVIPRHHKKMQDAETVANRLRDENLPDDQQLLEAILKARDDALSHAKDLGMTFSTMPQEVPLFITKTLMGIEDDSEQSGDEEDACEVEEADEEMPAEVAEDIIMQNEEVTEEQAVVSPTSPFLVFRENGKSSVIRKSTLVWRLTSSKFNLSSDRQERVKAAENCLLQMQQTALSKITVCENLCLGDWAVFSECPLPNRLYIGRIINFCYLSGTGKSRQYSETSVPLVEPQENARGVGCLGEWYTTPFAGNGKLTKFRKPHEYYNIKRYVCTLPMPVSEEGDLSYSPELLKSVTKAHPQLRKVNQTAAASKQKSTRMNKRCRRSGRTLFPSDSESDSETSAPAPLTQSPQEGDFVLVEFNSTKNPKCYVAKVLEEVDEEFDLQVSYLRRSEEGSFALPNIPDLASVQLDCVKMILPKPICTAGSSRRQQDLYKFNVNLEKFNVC